MVQGEVQVVQEVQKKVQQQQQYTEVGNEEVEVQHMQLPTQPAEVRMCH